MASTNGKLTIGILCGGKSAEHEVSLQSAKNVFDAIDRGRYEPVLVGIDKSGKWLLHDEARFLLNAGDPRTITLNPQGEPAALAPASGGHLSLAAQGAPKLDAVFPILHGPFGEDGTVQGLLKLADIPFVGSGVLGSAAGMDKDVMKRLLRDAGIPVGAFLTFRSHEAMPSFAQVQAALGSPFFLKPANMGSSVGISKVHNESEFPAALRLAFRYDTKIIAEEFIRGRELECAVLGNEQPAASVAGEVISSHEFYSYDAKYLDEKGAALVIPAQISGETLRRVQELSIQTFQTLCCEGLSRVDFFLREDGELLVNEINTMPGFTKISMYPKLWEASGVNYTELISRLISLAVSRFEKEQGLSVERAE